MNTHHLQKINALHLNAEQKKAVLTTKGKILILAGAGSGKTSTLSYRIAHLIENEGVSPSSILGLTFTNKAAHEMKERVGKIISNDKAKKINLCTFHSFCMQVLRSHIEKLGYTKKFSLYDEYDMKRLATQITRNLLEHEGKLPSIASTIEIVKELQQKSDDEIKELVNTSKWHDEFVKQLHEGLKLSLRAYNAVDFDSLISLTVRLFQNFPDVLELYQNQYQYVMIDEYQDTNPLQYLLASLLVSKHRNLCVVGDDDQSIYAWRGAEVKHILKFDYDILIKLEQNYRSSKNILNAANAVIKNNSERHAKTLWSTYRHENPIYLFHAPTDKEEAESAIERIVALRQEKGYKWRDFAILYRSNNLSRPFEVALMQTTWKDGSEWKRGIPYEVFGGEELYQKSEIKDLMSYLKVVANPSDQESLLRIINFPRRGISEKTLDLLTTANRACKISLWELMCKVANDDPSHQDLIHELSKKGFDSIKNFTLLMQDAINRFENNPLFSSLEWLVESIDYKSAISDEVKSEKMQSFKWDNVLECIQLLKSYEESSQNPTLEEFLSATYLDEKKFTRGKTSFEDRVNLMTFHSAKGLEFPVCFLVGIEDHLIPHEKSLLETGLEEERRLMYVALTRCKERLYLTMSRSRNKHGKQLPTSPSRFLHEIPKELLTMTSFKPIESFD